MSKERLAVSTDRFGFETGSFKVSMAIAQRTLIQAYSSLANIPFGDKGATRMRVYDLADAVRNMDKEISERIGDIENGGEDES